MSRARSASAPAGRARRRSLALVGAVLAAGVAACGLAPAAQAAPSASFVYAPERPLSLTTVTFTSTSAPGVDGAAIASQTWNLDNDGLFDDASGPSAKRAFPTPGKPTVSLKVVDVNGAEAVASQQLTVGNRRPKASIAFAPGTPEAGEPVSFFSTSSDQDGYIASQKWDLDNDGAFDDGTATLASRTFEAPGEYVVGLRATDNSGSSADAQLTVAVFPPGSALLLEQSAAAGKGVSSTGLLSPFPLVRIAGLVRSRGIVLRLLSIQAPVGTTVQVRCGGRGCPFKRQTRRVSAAASPGSPSGARVVKIRRFRRRLLRTGAIVRVLVSRPDAIGKYTRFRVRAGRLPARADRCLMPDGRTPMRCP